MKKVVLRLALVTFVLLFISGCAAPAAPQRDSDIVTVSFSFEKQQGYASNQFAVWVEDMDGNLIKTLYVTKFTAKGGFEKRPDALPVWVARSGLAQDANVDAATGATPKVGEVSFVWDLADESGARVADGTYRFFVEGTLRWKNQVLYTGEITLDGSATTAEAAAEYTYAESTDAPALTVESVENSMISGVMAEYIPPKQP
ncbi:MAG: DUF2271 domain-containing protein [Clostridiales bacterium]|nr:DUF2271 domain-containing protein [Clostridiales bacterium]